MIRLVAFVEDANLRTVCWQQKFLEQVKYDYKLKDGHAVVFCNAAQDRFRLVACFRGLAVLVLPPIDAAARHSLYLKVSEFLKTFGDSYKNVLKRVDSEIEMAQERIARRKLLARKASQKRGS